MPMSVRATAPDLKQLSRDLKAAGRKDLQKELFRGLNRATKPVRGDIKANALAHLPSEGGLNQRVAAATVTVRNSGGRVRIVAKPSQRGGPFDPAQVNAGAVSHPTFGHKPTKTQPVSKDWFDDPIRAVEPDVVQALLDGIDKVAADLAAG